MAAKVTVIMPAYNAARHIGAAIESVQAQTLADWRLNIVDDGSTDDTSAVVETYLADDRISLERQENAGPSAARNRAIAAASTPYLAILDSDDLYAPEYLERMTGALDEDAALAFCCCDAWLFTGEPVPGQRASATAPMKPPITFERVLAREFQVYGETTMRRDWFDRVGGYDPALRTAEDLYLWLKMLRDGAAARYLDAPLAWYRGHPNSLSRDTERVHADNIAVYDLIRKARPDVAGICDRKSRESRYEIALHRAKAALADKRFDDFFAQSDEVFRNGENAKLRAVVAVAKAAPGLAHTLFSRR